MDANSVTDGQRVGAEEGRVARKFVFHSHWGEGVYSVIQPSPCSEKTEGTRFAVSFALKKRRTGFGVLLLKFILAGFALFAVLSLAAYLRTHSGKQVEPSRDHRLSDGEEDSEGSRTPSSAPSSPYGGPSSGSLTWERPSSSSWSPWQTESPQSAEARPIRVRLEYPRLRHLDATKYFSLRRAFSRRVYFAELVRNLSILHHFFRRESLSLLEGNKFIDSTEAVVAHLFTHERTRVDGLPLDRALRVLERRFVICQTLDFALHILGELYNGFWWKHLTIGMPHEYTMPPPATGVQEDAELRNLVARLSAAVGRLKSGMDPEDDELRRDVAQYRDSMLNLDQLSDGDTSGSSAHPDDGR